MTTVELVPDGPVDSATGVYIDINIDPTLEQTIRNISELDAEVKSDVAVSFRGRVKRYTLQEFLQKLGFGEKPDALTKSTEAEQ